MSMSFVGYIRRNPDHFDEYMRAAYGQKEEYCGTPYESRLEQAEESHGDIQGGTAPGQGGSVVYGPWPGTAPQDGEGTGG